MSPFRSLLLTSISALSLSACSGGSSPVTDNVGACYSMKNSNAVVTSSLSTPCVGCSLTDAAKGADGDFNSAAVFMGGGPSTQTATVRATAQSGIVFPAGSNPGVIFENAGNTYYSLTITTYLAGAVQETGSICGLCGHGQPGYQKSNFTATKAFDAVEVALGSTQNGDVGTVTQKVFEICSN